jgi:hypothetical protein
MITTTIIISTKVNPREAERTGRWAAAFMAMAGNYPGRHRPAMFHVAKSRKTAGVFSL